MSDLQLDICKELSVAVTTRDGVNLAIEEAELNGEAVTVTLDCTFQELANAYGLRQMEKELIA